MQETCIELMYVILCSIFWDGGLGNLWLREPLIYTRVIVLAFSIIVIQALWRCLRTPPDTVAHVAFRVLGKFGGSNRKMLREPQKVGVM